MVGLFSGDEQELQGNIMQQRQQANQALGSGFGKYGGIVQAGGAMVDVGADATTGGAVGSADPRMQQMQGAKAVFAQVAKEMGEVSSVNFYERLSKELAAKGFTEPAQKAADKAMAVKKEEFAMKPPEPKDTALELAKTGKYTPESVKEAVANKDYSLLKRVDPESKKTELEKSMDLAGVTDPKKRQEMAQKHLALKLKADKGDPTAKMALDLLNKQLDITLKQQKVKAADEEVEAAKKASALKSKAGAYKTSNIINTIDTSLSQVGGNTAGVGGSLLGKIPGTEATDLQANLETIAANLGFDQLQAMRDASPTGGALGQVSERELLALQSTVASLKREQSPEQLRKNLAKVREHYQNWLATLDGVNPDDKKPAEAADDDALINKYLGG